MDSVPSTWPSLFLRELELAWRETFYGESLQRYECKEILMQVFDPNSTSFLMREEVFPTLNCPQSERLFDTRSSKLSPAFIDFLFISFKCFIFTSFSSFSM